MTYDLYIGDRTYSSWSLRGWLLFEKFGIPVSTHMVPFGSDRSVADQLAGMVPARTVPTLRTPEGAVICESMAIAEELATRHPDAGIWPDDPLARATARTLAAEMHAGFTALRGFCPMNLRVRFAGVEPPEEVLADLDRLEVIWANARAVCGGEGPWLFGDYSAADAFFAPVAARIAGYGLPVSERAHNYAMAHLNDGAFRRWRAMGLVEGESLKKYAKPYDTVPWPGPKPVEARAVESGRPENDACPYSGKPVIHLAEVGGRVFGFCNSFCRDKTVADPAAWPKFMQIYDS